MPKTVACLVVRSAKVFSWLGHMPIMNWSVERLTEVRGVDRIVCAAAPNLVDQARRLLAAEKIDVVAMPPELTGAKDALLDKWLTAATGPAAEADTVVVVRPTNPLLPASKVEACVAAVNRGKCSVCYPARPTKVVISAKTATAKEAVDSVRVFRVNVPAEKVTVHTVPVSLMESLDVDNHDQFVMIDALVASDKV